MWYEMCYNECTQWEVNKMSEELDDKAMDKEWTRMQDDLARENADVHCHCGWAGMVNDLNIGFIVNDEKTVCCCPECGSYNDYDIES